MPADSLSPKVDERIFIWPCEHGAFTTPPQRDAYGRCKECATSPAVYVPASLVDELRAERDEFEDLYLTWKAAAETREAERDTTRDALHEIADALQHGEMVALNKISGILANGPLASAPGGGSEDECARLRAERDALKEKNTALCMTLAGRDETVTALRAEVKATAGEALDLKVECALRGDRIDALTARVEFFEERERYIARLLRVTDLGQQHRLSGSSTWPWSVSANRCAAASTWMPLDLPLRCWDCGADVSMGRRGHDWDQGRHWASVYCYGCLVADRAELTANNEEDGHGA